MIDDARHDEQQVRQPVHIRQQMRFDVFGAERHDRAFGAPADGPREMQQSAGAIAAGQDETAQGRELAFEPIDPVFETLDVYIGDGHFRDAIGNLLGTRMVLNEFIAYSQLGPMKAAIDPKSFTIATFALCGFANLGSIGIQIGGISALAPNRRHDLARLGIRAMLAGTLANFMTAAIAGLLV